VRSTDRDEALKRSKFAVFSDTGRFLRGPTMMREKAALAEAAEKRGIGLGELVHVMTDAVGIKQCSPCAQRQKILDVFQIPESMIPWAKVKEKVMELRGEDETEIKVTWDDNG